MWDKTLHKGTSTLDLFCDYKPEIGSLKKKNSTERDCEEGGWAFLTSGVTCVS